LPVLVSIIFCAVAAAGAVPVAPNAGIILAEVQRVEPSDKPGAVWLLEVRIISSEDVEGLPNFVKDKVDSVLQMYTKEDTAAFKKGNIITARVTYSGDERGGLFWATKISRLAK
jgi:hypothetical protein